MQENQPPKSKRKIFVILLLTLYVVAAAVFYFSYLNVGANGGETVGLKYAAVCMGLAVAWVFVSRPRLDQVLISVAITFSVAADWFLLVVNRQYVAGIFLFICAQIAYAFVVVPKGLGIKVDLFVRFGLLLVVLVVAVIAGLTDATELVAATYLAMLVANLIEAYHAAAKRRLTWLLALGLTLFLCCDVCVGMFHTVSYGSPWFAFCETGMWAFYLPSQVLIVISKFLPNRMVEHD